MSLFRKKPAPPEYQPDPANPSSGVLWDSTHSLFFFYAVMAGKALNVVSDAVLGALAPSQFGSLLNLDGSPNAFTTLPAYQAHSDDFAIDSAGWQIAIVGVESPDHDASALLWWIQGSGDEASRFHSCVLDAQVEAVVRSLSAIPCTVIESRVGEDTWNLDEVLERRQSLPLVRNHELGRRLASWPITPITPISR